MRPAGPGVDRDQLGPLDAEGVLQAPPRGLGAFPLLHLDHATGRQHLALGEGPLGDPRGSEERWGGDGGLHARRGVRRGARHRAEAQQRDDEPHQDAVHAEIVGVRRPAVTTGNPIGALGQVRTRSAAGSRARRRSGTAVRAAGSSRRRSARIVFGLIPNRRARPEQTPATQRSCRGAGTGCGVQVRCSCHRGCLAHAPKSSPRRRSESQGGRRRQGCFFTRWSSASDPVSMSA